MINGGYEVEMGKKLILLLQKREKKARRKSSPRNSCGGYSCVAVGLSRNPNYNAFPCISSLSYMTV